MDFSYLSRETFGDHRLEMDLLELFVAQARSLIPQLPNSPAHGEVVHLLKGSALAAGAPRIAAAVEAYGHAPARARAADGNLYQEVVAAFQQAEAAIEARLVLLREQSGDRAP